jgi:hypothetical protein
LGLRESLIGRLQGDWVEYDLLRHAKSVGSPFASAFQLRVYPMRVGMLAELADFPEFQLVFPSQLPKDVQIA